MNMIDFIIGLTLVNAIPHFVLGIWKGRMLSGFGIGNTKNIAYAMLNTAISVGLFLYAYGWKGLWENPLYLGGLFTLVCYFLVGKLFYQKYHKSYYNSDAPIKVE